MFFCCCFVSSIHMMIQTLDLSEIFLSIYMMKLYYYYYYYY